MISYVPTLCFRTRRKDDLRSVKAENVSPIAGFPPANEVKYGYVLYLHSACGIWRLEEMGIESRLTYNLDTTEEREISRIYESATPLNESKRKERIRSCVYNGPLALRSYPALVPRS
jgi:hypothetical protein